MVTYQLTRSEREALDAMFVVAGLRRPVWRLSMEWTKSGTPLLLTHYSMGTAEERHIANCQSHGRWIEWLA
jgi:hypothetical protein